MYLYRVYVCGLVLTLGVAAAACYQSDPSHVHITFLTFLHRRRLPIARQSRYNTHFSATCRFRMTDKLTKEGIPRQRKSWIHTPEVLTLPRSFLQPISTQTPVSERNSLLTPPESPVTPTITLSALSSAPLAPPFQQQNPTLSSTYDNHYKALHAICDIIHHNFRGLGEFLVMLFENVQKGDVNKRSERHRTMVKVLLQGTTKVRTVNVTVAMYKNRYSNPSYKSKLYGIETLFLCHSDPHSFHYARPGLSSWAVSLVTKECRYQIKDLTNDDPDSSVRTRLRLSANSCQQFEGLKWSDVVENLDVSKLEEEFRRRSPLAWHVMEQMAAPLNHVGPPVVRKRHPYPLVRHISLSES
jgi:hypothetical protein